MLKICSFNCHSLKSSIPEVRLLCNDHDIVFLQETWLATFELAVLNTIHKEFLGMGISAMDSSAGLLRGRPFEGLVILWKRRLQPSINISNIDKRIMRLDVQTDTGLVCLFNVYLQTDYGSRDCLDDFCTGA